MGKSGQTVGVGTAPENDNALTVNGHTVTKGSWSIVAGQNTNNTNEITIKPDVQGTVITGRKPLFFQSRSNGVYASSSYGTPVAYAQNDDFSFSFSRLPMHLTGYQLFVNAADPVSVMQHGKQIDLNHGVAVVGSMDGIQVNGITVSCRGIDSRNCVAGSLDKVINYYGNNNKEYSISFRKFKKDPIRVMMGFRP